METGHEATSRRDFLRSSAAAVPALGGGPLLRPARPVPRSYKIALVGCGGRGNGALENHLEAVKFINAKLNLDLQATLVATADYEKGNAERTGRKYGVPAEKCFGGAGGYRQAIEAGPDIVLFATPPCFRPPHLQAAVEAGKHVFMEKPVAVDPPGVRRILAAGENAKKKGLTVVAGTQRRHSKGYNERWQAIKEGLTGRILGGRVAWCMGKFFGEKPLNPRTPGDLVGQGRWWCWNMISGDHIVEQHVHNIDIANWYLQAHPVSARGFGGRARRVGGNMFDFFSVDFEYPGRIHIHSMCRQVAGCWDWVGEEFTYEKGGGRPQEPPPYFEYPRQGNDYVDEHIHLILSALGIVAKEPINEAQNVAWATAAAIMGRESAYSGAEVKWADMFEKETHPLYSLAMKPSADDFEKGGEIELPKDGDIRIPGKA